MDDTEHYRDAVTNDDVFVSAWEYMQRKAHTNAINKGWWEKRDKAVEVLNAAGLGAYGKQLVMSQAILLEHCELSEGVEGMRKDLKDDKCPEFDMVVVEHADVIIRMLDLAEKNQWPLAEAIIAKMKMNEGRPHMHGGKAF